MNDKAKTDVSKKSLKVLPIVIVICVAAVIVAVVLVKLSSSKAETPAQQQIGVEANVITNDQDVANMEMGSSDEFTTFYQRDIYVENGHEARGMIGNSADNPYEDMYIQIFLNDEESDEPTDEIYLSQIIPRGSHIEEFDLEQDLDTGDYRATLVHAVIDEEGVLIKNIPVIVEIHVS